MAEQQATETKPNGNGATPPPETHEGDADEGRTDAEERAYAQGWRPETEYTGSKPWIDADTFLKRGEQIQPLLLKDVRSLRSENAELKTMLRDLVTSQKAQTQKAVDRAIADLKVKKKAAVSEGNVDAVEQIDNAIDELKAAPETKPSAVTSTPPEFTEWVSENDWFEENPLLAKEAIEYYGALESSPKTRALSDKEKLTRVTKMIKAKYSEEFPAAPNGNGNGQRRQQHSTVESGGAGGGGQRQSGKKSWNDLPPDVRVIADRLVAKKVVTKEQYLADFQW